MQTLTQVSENLGTLLLWCALGASVMASVGVALVAAQMARQGRTLYHLSQIIGIHTVQLTNHEKLLRNRNPVFSQQTAIKQPSNGNDAAEPR
jgi:hypothetical protein